MEDPCSPITSSYRATSLPSTPPPIPNSNSGSSFPSWQLTAPTRRTCLPRLPRRRPPSLVFTGVAFKSCKLKRLGRARRRVPLRNITNLIVAQSAVAEWQQALLQQPHAASATATEEPVAKNGLAGGAGSKAGRYSLRKEFR